MNIGTLKEGLMEYAHWVKEYRRRYMETQKPSKLQESGAFEQALVAMPRLDPEFEDKTLVYELRNALEATFDKRLDVLLQPLLESDDPE